MNTVCSLNANAMPMNTNDAIGLSLCKNQDCKDYKRGVN